jgi:hypothetical protein
MLYEKLNMSALKINTVSVSLLLAIVLLVCSVNRSYAQDLKFENFKNPEKQYRPKTWMHAMSANMSKEGITKDLESMQKAGLSGLLLFNITQGIPNGNVKYASKEHIDILKHAASEAERLGLSFGVHNADGWSASGGPWVPANQSMKMVVWSELVAKGGSNLNFKIQQPTTKERYYQDIITIAYPSLNADLLDQKEAKITSSDNQTDLKNLTDGKNDRALKIKKVGNLNPTLTFEYPSVQPLQSVFCVFNEGSIKAEFFGSNDGKDYKSITKIVEQRTGKGERILTASFEQQNYKFYKLEFNNEVSLKEVTLSSVYKIVDMYGRTSMARIERQDLSPIGNPSAQMIINKKDIIDVSKYVDKDGNFKGSLPAGNWTIMRFGQTSNGAVNQPASKEGKGLEVDKLSRAAFKNHYDNFIKKVVDAARQVSPNALQYVEIDSYEMGGQNWTDGLDSLFMKQYGYDLLTFMPLYAGKFVECASSSDAVLSDLRNLISNLMTNNYFGYFQELCHKDGLKTYIENYGFGPLNDLEIGSKADIPMGEFWMNREIDQVASPISSAHIYGKKVISAESFTTTPQINWKGHPAMAKATGDKAWALGINEFMFHRFAHQANTHVEPGMTMNRWGFHMDRTQTWWYNAGSAWFTYIARGAYLLRQGNPVSDLLVFVGDESPNGSFSKKSLKPTLPNGINFDNVNSDVIINRLGVKNNELILPEGTTYKALVIKNSERLRIKTLIKIAELSKKGAVIIGDRPIGLLGYVDSKSEEIAFNKLVSEIWSSKNTYSGYNWACIFPKINLKADFLVNGRDDFDFMHRRVSEIDSYFSFNPDSVAHTFKIRINVNGKVPEIWNPMDGSTKVLAQYQEKDGFTYLSVDLLPQQSFFIVFKPTTNQFITVKPDKDYKNIDFFRNDKKQLQANVSEKGSYKIELSNGNSWQFNVNNLAKPLNISGAWDVKFNKNQGYGGTEKFNQLTDWKDAAKDSIKYFSGTATYYKTINIPANYLKKENSYLLDLGDVSIVAQLKLNGTDLGVLWIPPFKTDITKYLKVGDNTLEIEVTNQWSNRLIGDERYPKQDGGYEMQNGKSEGKMPEWYINNLPMPTGPRTTFTTASFYNKNSPLVSSGLLGPVKIIPSVNVLFKD